MGDVCSMHITVIHAYETLIGKFDRNGRRGSRNRKWKDNITTNV
jgi:hypothetical protein